MPSSTRWRLYITDTNASPSVSIGALQMASSAAGADLCTGGTPSADSVWGSPGYEANKAFDGNVATRWNNAASSLPAWLEYEFASAQTIVEYRIQAGSDYAGNLPKAFQFQYWDGSAWVVVDSQTAQTGWTTSLTRTYAFYPTSALRVSRVDVEAVSAQAATTGIRVSRVDVEAVTPQAAATGIRVSQVAVETVTPNLVADVRVTKLHVEALTQNSAADVRVSKLHVEVLTQNSAADVRVSKLHVEVLSTTAPAGWVGTLAATLDALTVTATGTVASGVSGTLAATLDALTVAATGTVADPPVLGTLAVTLDPLTLAATGTVTSTATTVDQYALEYVVDLAQVVYLGAGPSVCGDVQVMTWIETTSDVL